MTKRIAIALALSGCHGVSASAPARGPTPVSMLDAPPAENLCDELVPPSLRATMFPRLTMRELDAARDGVICRFDGGERLSVVSLDCANPELLGDRFASGRASLHDITELEGHEHGYGYAGVDAIGTPVLDLFDDDAKCLISATGFRGDAASFAMALERTTTVALGERVRAKTSP